MGWRRSPAVHAVLLLATLASVGVTHWFVFGGGVDSRDPGEQAVGAALFALCVLLILGAHEMGHYLLARHHRVPCTLPYFIPLPLLGFGTLGAVIRLEGRVPTRTALVDIGAAGPLAGLAIALPLMVSGLTLSHVGPVPPLPPRDWPPLSGLGLAQELAGWAVPGLLPEASPPLGLQVYGDSALTWLLQRVVVGPLPPGHELYVHPVYLAAWFGLLVTMLNLLPVGQLDGGHLTHALFGQRAQTLGRVVAWALLGLSLISSITWLAWYLLVTRVVRFGHPPVLAPEAPLDRLRTGVAWLGLALAALLFMPAPMGML